MTTMQVDAVWESVEWPGMEHVVMAESSRVRRIDGVAVAVLDKRPFRVAYRLTCDASWRTRRLTVSGPGRRLDLRSDGAGNWTDAVTDRPMPELDGCVDVDLTVTPSTNTLPIRRLGLSPGMARDVKVAYVEIPDLTVRAVMQRYTRTSRDEYLYESGNFRASLPVDEHGLVLDYPGEWRRIPTAARSLPVPPLLGRYRPHRSLVVTGPTASRSLSPPPQPASRGPAPPSPLAPRIPLAPRASP
jgi:hypothetical protein